MVIAISAKTYGMILVVTPQKTKKTSVMILDLLNHVLAKTLRWQDVMIVTTKLMMTRRRMR